MPAVPSSKDTTMSILDFKQKEARTYSDALDAWRSASDLVRYRWHRFRVADGDDRSATFAAYVAALDNEEAAAAVLALFTVDQAA
jgi:uncharacterized damage-inducible protein DinB